MTRNNRLPTATLRSLLLAGAAFGFGSAAFAQDASTPAQPSGEQVAAGETQTEEPADISTPNPGATTDDQEVVVTGSRIRRSEFTSPDPIAIINPEIAQREGKLDTATMLQSSPIAAGSTQITSALSSNFLTPGGPGSQTLDLRGLGPNRTLVLLNGRRAGPAGTRGAVSAFDLNVLPQSIVQNVEILKTGASSVYGSDAIAGVVNLITKRSTDGLQLDLNTIIPQEGGGEQYRASAIWGKDFGRGYLLLAGDYFRQNELARGDRKALGCPEAYIFRRDGSRADLIDPRDGQFKCEDLRWGHVWTYDLIGNMRLDGPGGPNTGVNTAPGGVNLIQFQYPGQNLGIPAYGAPDFAGDLGVPAGWFPTGYNAAAMAVQNSYHPFVNEQSIIPKTTRVTGYLTAGIELTDDIEAFGEFLVNRRKTYQNGWRQFWNFGFTGDLYGTGNLYGTGTIWGQGWQGVNFLSPTGITNLSDSSQTVDYYRTVGGLRGDIGFLPGWKFDSYVQYSRSNGKYRNQQILQDVYDSGYFQTSSCVGTVLPVSGKACIDLPWTDPFFLAGALTQQQADFLTSWETGKTVYTQLNGEFAVNGTLFRLPAGPLQVALGATIRRDRINDLPGEITRVGNAWGTSEAGLTAGEGITREAFGEVNVPLFRDRPFARDLSLSAAARVTSVEQTRKQDGRSESDNGNWTYKISGNWAVNSWLRFRGGYGTSYRAPALFEQFLADETGSLAQGRVDPCIQWAARLALGQTTQRVANNCAADGIPGNHAGGGVSATTVARGGFDFRSLTAETSKAKTASIILTPTFGFLPDTRVSLAVDWFDIEVNDQVTQLGAANVVFGCYNSDNFANEPLCELVTRGQFGAPFNIATIIDPFINIATQRNAGFDFTTNIRHNAGRFGTFNFLGSATLQDKDFIELFEGSNANGSGNNNGEIGSPKFVADLNLTWTSAGDSGWSVFYGVDIIGKSSNRADLLRATGGRECINSTIYGEYCPKVNTPTVFYHNASITKELDAFDLTLGVSNLFNTQPPRVSVLNGGTITTLGPVPFSSQYDFVGRRFFINATARFGRKR